VLRAVHFPGMQLSLNDIMRSPRTTKSLNTTSQKGFVPVIIVSQDHRSSSVIVVVQSLTYSAWGSLADGLKALIVMQPKVPASEGTVNCGVTSVRIHLIECLVCYRLTLSICGRKRDMATTRMGVRRYGMKTIDIVKVLALGYSHSASCSATLSTGLS